MGYYANGAGYINLKKIKDDSVFDRIADKISYVFSTSFEEKETRWEVDVYTDDKYYSDDLDELFTEIAPYTIDGDIRYTGEDETHWRFFFDKTKNEWAEESGWVVFPGALNELPEGLMREIHSHYDREAKKEDLLSALLERVSDKVPEEKLEPVVDAAVDIFENYKSKSDPFWDCYWQLIEFAIDEILRLEEDM